MMPPVPGRSINSPNKRGICGESLSSMFFLCPAVSLCFRGQSILAGEDAPQENGCQGCKKMVKSAAIEACGGCMSVCRPSLASNDFL
jgi:hypothetical protein